MKRAILPILVVAMLLSSLLASVLSAQAGDPEGSGYGMNTTRVQQMGMGDLDMVMYDEPQEVNIYGLSGNIAGLVWDEPTSSLEGNFSYGSGSYTSEYGTKESWSYMGNAFPVYQGFPLMETLFSLFYGNRGLPAPGVTLSLKRQSATFFLSGGYARDANKSESQYGDTYETSHSSPQFGFGISALTSPEFSFGLAFDYIPIKEKYTYSYNGSSSSNEESFNKFGGQIGLCRRRKSSGRFQTTSGGEFQYISADINDSDMSFWSIGVAHVGGFSVGYGTVTLKVGRMTLGGDDGMTDIEVGGRIFFQAPQSPLLLSISFNRISLSEENVSPSQTTFSGGIGISVPAIYAGIEYLNDSFKESSITSIEALKFGSELRSLRPLIFRAGYKKMTTKGGGWFPNIDEDIITGGVGLRIVPKNVSVDLAYNNSKETYLMTFDETKVTDHIFALSLKKGF